VCGGFIVLSETAFKPLPLCLVWSAIDFPLCVCLVCAFASSKRDRFFILCRFALFASAIDFLCAFAWWWLYSSKRNSFLILCRFALFASAIDFTLCVCFVWWLWSSKRNSF